MDDWQLLKEYATRNSEEAFRTLVARYAGTVYHAALRQLGNPHAAEEVTQAVFIALAQKARALPSSTVLCGWLFRATRFAVLNLLRDETCRRRYEKQASDFMTPSHEAETVWQQLAPHLDDALDRLPRRDRALVITRFFGNKSHKELARAIGITEDTAKKRLSRALEKLRVIFARRGVAVSSVALLAAFATCAAEAAPAGLSSSVTAAALAHGAAATTSGATLAEAILKLMAWAKAKTALVMGTGILFAAAGSAVVALNADPAPAAPLITNLARQSGKHIVWDKHLLIPAELALTGLPLERALDKIAVQADAYWSIDYVVYDSDAALRSLLSLLHEGTTLDSGGWSNLSSMALEPHVAVTPYDPHGRVRMFLRVPAGQSGGNVAMMVVLGPEADPQLEPVHPSAPGGSPIRLTAPPPDGLAAKLVRQAMLEGVADGVLAPERLLAQTRLIPAMNPDTPVAATPETATRLANAARAKWTTVYTLRKSPIKGAGIKLVHAGMENMYGPNKLSPNPEGLANGLESNRFNLSPQDRDAHQRAVEDWKKQH